MNKIKQHINILITLLIISFIMFFVHFLVFKRLYNTIYYSTMNICFIPVNILIVTFVLEDIVERNKRADRLSKLSMLIGVFFSDMGIELLNLLVVGDEKLKYLRLDFSDLRDCKKKFSLYKHEIEFNKVDFNKIKQLMVGNRDILSDLISNENISEHERFSDLLMTLMHLRDEIMFMGDRTMSEEDMEHMEVDLGRVYKALSLQWTSYLKHIKQFYPYQYTSAMRINPFKEFSK